MVLDLEIEAPGQVPRDAPAIGAAGLNLGLVPVDRLARLPRLSDGVTLRILEVVRECEGNGERERFHHAHVPDVPARQQRRVVQEWSRARAGQIEESQADGVWTVCAQGGAVEDDRRAAVKVRLHHWEGLPCATEDPGLHP